MASTGLAWAVNNSPTTSAWSFEAVTCSGVQPSVTAVREFLKDLGGGSSQPFPRGWVLPAVAPNWPKM